MSANSNPLALIYGGKGALGSQLVEAFKKKNWVVYSVDMDQNKLANISIVIDGEDTFSEQESVILNAVEDALKKKGGKIDAIICVAGGWAGGNAESKDFCKIADLMWKQSVWSSLIASHAAAKYLSPGGLLVLTGANAALSPTPGMIGYGMAKAAVHHLVKSLGADGSGIPAGSCVTAILPITLDTPANRKNMPKADTSTWTPLEWVADLLVKWALNENRPKTGSLCKLETINSQSGHTVVE